MTDQDKTLFGELVERRKGAPPFPEQWTNAHVARIVHLAMTGHSSPAIARELGGQIDPDDIKRMLLHWGVKPQAGNRRNMPVPVMLSAHDRTQLHEQAKKRGISMGELARRIIHTLNVATTGGLDLYANVLDDD